MKIRDTHKFPCGMETDRTVEAWGGFFWLTFKDKHIDCPIHGSNCKPTIKVAMEREYR